jgi:hypothetical protein
VKLTNTADFVCEVCSTSKQRKQPIADLAARRDVQPGEILHCDIKGPLESSYNRAKYTLVVVDEATRMVAAQHMRTKDKLVEALKSIVSRFASLPGKPIVFGKGSILHCDSEAVFLSSEMSSYLASLQATPRASPPHTHERNGIAERAIQTVFDTTRALLQQAEMPDNLWPVALQHAVYLRNRAPTQALGGRVPCEVLTGTTASIFKLYKFGCKVFVKVDNALRSALDPKSRAGIYVGHSDLSDSYRVLVRNTNRWDMVDSIHCTFHESECGMAAPGSTAATPAAAPPAASPPAAPAAAAPTRPPPSSRQQLASG